MDAKSDDVEAALAAVGLPGLKVVADQQDIAAQERKPECRVRFARALRLALEAFMTNGSGSPGHGHDSAVDVVRDAPDAYNLAVEPSDAEIAEALRSILADDLHAQAVLLTPTTIGQQEFSFLPEYGESIADNWIFRIIAPGSWPMLQWSIVDLRGETPPYSYGFD
jgi:hypothetical protein